MDADRPRRAASPAQKATAKKATAATKATAKKATATKATTPKATAKKATAATKATAKKATATKATTPKATAKKATTAKKAAAAKGTTAQKKTTSPAKARQRGTATAPPDIGPEPDQARPTPAKKTSPAKTSRARKATAAPPTKEAAKKVAKKVVRPTRQPDQQPAQGPAQEPDQEPAQKPAQELAARPTNALSLRTVDDLWGRLRLDPGFATELLAEAAVATHGPQARVWADRMRATYPTAPAAAVARLATVEHVRLATATGATAYLAGLIAPLAAGAGLGSLQARLVLRIAAAYGVDATAPERAVDLLVLSGAHPDEDTAAEALARARAATRPSGTTAAGIVAGQVTGWLARRTLSRFVPGAGIVLSALAAVDATKALAARADRHYRRLADNK